MKIRGLGASIELSRVLEHAKDLADGSERSLDTGHILLAMFIDDNRARGLLLEKLNAARDIALAPGDLDPLVGALQVLWNGEGEPVDTVSVVHMKTADFTKSCGSDVVGTLHLLAGLCRVQRSVAFQALEALRIHPAEVRTAVIRYLSGSMPRHYISPSAIPHADRVRPSVLGRDGGDRGTQVQVEVEELEPEVEIEPEPLPRTTSRPGPRPEVAPARSPEPRAPSSFTKPSEAGERRRPTEPPRNGKVPDARPAAALGSTRPSDGRATPRSRYELDPEAYPALLKLGRNLTVLADRGELDPLVGRGREVDQLVDILNKRRANNPCLVGEPGVGKTAVVEGLAQLIVKHDSRVGALGEKIIVELDMGTIVAGTQLRGAFSERLRAVKDEVSRADGRIVLFIDELHTLIGAGAGDGALDAANELKTALARGEMPCIGSTTDREYRKYIESDPALARRFQTVIVDEPSPDEAIKVLEGLTPSYSAHHRVQYRREAIEGAVRLAERWISDRFLPAKAIDVLDLAGAFAARHQKSWVDASDVAHVVALKVGLSEARLLESDAKRLLSLERFLCERVVAHDDEMKRVAAVVRRNAAGFVSNRPMGSFLLLGPTGVGKTECARVLAEFLFGSRESLSRIDMSEYVDAHSVSRLIGAPPGYVGHEDGGQLTEAVRRRPYQIILFDEIEKAASEVWNVLLQLLEEGVLTDGRGRKVRFRNTVIMITTNLGQAELTSSARPVGFGAVTASGSDLSRKALQAAEKGFSPELWNRIEEKLVFTPLKRESVLAIVTLLISESSERLRRERGIVYRVTPEVKELLARRGFDERLGARPLRRILQQVVENAIADAILEEGLPAGTTLVVDVDGDGVKVTRVAS
ncbi:MAG: AAA family ATPase [Myxococcales bacterium]|nr:AAA family ATPase [Myxococcales bacterium]